MYKSEREKLCTICKISFTVDEKTLKHSPYLFGSKDLASSFICEDCYAIQGDKGFSASVDWSEDMTQQEEKESR